MKTDPEQVEDITVVGGGDIGLLSALALNKGTDAKVVVIDDFQQPIPEVGKSTLTYVVVFLHEVLDIKPDRFIENVKLSFKTTVYFEDWCGVEPFHSPLGRSIPITAELNEDLRPRELTAQNEEEFHELYYRYLTGDFTNMYGKIAETPGKTPYVIGDNVTQINFGVPEASYQFNARSFNQYLRTICRERGIELINDRVNDIATTNNRITSVNSSETQYKADLYIDASGFERILMEELDNDFIEFDLPVDSAVVQTTDIPLSEVTSATVVTSGEAGWFWQIDTGGDSKGLRDLGYVYSSDHISDEEALQEFVETRDEDIDPETAQFYQFNSGVLKSPWKANCVAVGNALGFIEPLQSTALATACLLLNRLTELMGKHGRVVHDGLRKVYNKTTIETWREVYEFVSIFYKYNSGSTPFWEDARSIRPEPGEFYETYQDSGFSAAEEVDKLTRPMTWVNQAYLYFLILRSLGVESEFYENLDFEPDPHVAQQVDDHTSGVEDRLNEFLSYEEYYVTFHAGYE
jgi:tryptophan halogenase